MRSQMFRLGSALVLAAVCAGAPPAHAQSATATVPKTADTAALPDAKTILERHVEAVGGRKALAARNSVKTTGTIEIPANGITGTLEAYSARPNKMFIKQSLAGVGEITEGFDGTNGWSINPVTGPTLLTGEELAQRAFDSDFDSTLNAATRFTSMKTLEKTQFDGRECYKVALVRKDGAEDIEFYDVATGLKAGTTGTRKTQMGPITSTQTVKEYKKFGDLLQPTVIAQSAMGVELTITFKTYEYDTVQPSVFEPPAPIKALLEKK